MYTYDMYHVYVVVIIQIDRYIYRWYMYTLPPLQFFYLFLKKTIFTIFPSGFSTLDSFSVLEKVNVASLAVILLVLSDSLEPRLL